MLVACRLAGQSALEAHHAGVNTQAQLAERLDALAQSRSRPWWRRFVGYRLSCLARKNRQMAS